METGKEIASIQAVLFDIDGTLLDSLATNREFYQILLKEAGYPLPSPAELDACHYLSSRNAIEKFTHTTDEAEIQRVVELARSLTYDARHPQTLMPETLAALQKLNGRLPLGVVSNRNRQFLWEAPLDQVQRYFSVAVCYEDTENHKPHPEPLLLAASKLGVEPGRCVYIGDARTDLEAAKTGGFGFAQHGQESFSGSDFASPSLRAIATWILGENA